MLALLLALLLAGCAGVTPVQGAVAAADVASVAVLGRGVGDAVYSGVTGRDCSVVRLEQGKTYCKPPEAPPARPPYCTRTLGYIECWSNPEALPGPPHEVADGPRVLTRAQEADRTRRWPGW
ncbi:MAG: hypothetical protein BGP12_20915 [Rhodospirillales bacterium 70-18]|nr:hypothetical protein [Rhodospirillales bacterium]OJY70580.1 MAG: hypothetical protein BGP12_20915 [Rhodospirillales bacterium 70-18]